ncbi:flagellar biosynthesis protein FlgE [Clostridium tetani]|nr:flagellar biosynthesis protein FlgE [Clostridium tetani]RXI51114.1 flagellar biosynthesis protein FlgE [Clostridium tetani]RXM57099.1 flagellar biosynthesis protein FlgE [Clostridium tetani]RXM68251.1 flagellar biosynthesis protein FlgE [Clostridium tetani]RXM78487.1 flagellar biosynthesis protein FlgE [Clostridium tetani]
MPKLCGVIEAEQNKLFENNGGLYMLRSMFSGISGLKANQTKLDVIGNNIANVNTTAFKNQRIRFQDVLSQNLKFGTGASANVGGTNPSQVGLGVEVAGIDTVVSQGNMQPTGRNLDFAVDGDGYFVVARGKADETLENLDVYYTRDGAFGLDDFGQLLTSDGYRVLGYEIKEATIDNTKTPPTLTIPTEEKVIGKDSKGKDIKKTVPKQGDKIEADGDLKPLIIPDEVEYGGEKMKIKNFSVDKNGVINAVLANNEIVAIGQIGMANFKNSAGLYKEGKNLYSGSASSGEAIYRDGVDPANKNSNEKGYGDVIQGRLEMSNVDLAEQFTEMIVASRAFQANGKIITTGDEILQDLVNLKR